MIIKEDYKGEFGDGLYPNMFVSEKKKRTKAYIKSIVDYFYSQAISQYVHNSRTFARNYRLLKGDLSREDFYEGLDDNTKAFIDELTEDIKLPSYVQNYSIMNQPINTMRGEQAQRPDNRTIKDFSDNSKAEELQFRTELLNRYIEQKIRENIYRKAVESGVDLEDPEQAEAINQITEQELQEQLTSYTTNAEKWGNRILEALKMEFNTPEQLDEAFYDLLTVGRPRFHVYEDRSKIGFKGEVVNPKNVWYSSTPDKKYLRDAYAAGLIEVMEISEIIDKFSLTKEEVDVLKDEYKSLYDNNYTSNLFTNRTGISSIDYNPQNPYKRQEQMIAESALMDETYDTEEIFYRTEGNGILGQKHIVLTAYSQSKKKVGLLKYIDIDGIEQATLVDENYRDGSHPQEISIEWGYDNQWWKHVKIGNYVYKSEPFELLPYCPIIGLDFEKRNSQVKGLVDILAPYQAIVNVCYMQLWELLQKEKGVVFEFNPRKIQVGKDETFEEAIQRWMQTAEELGYVFSDDNPENLSSPISNTSVSRAVDLTRGNEMVSRLNIINAIRQEAHLLVGVNQERMGNISATMTATGAQAALSSSYSQTESWFKAHENIVNQYYQALVDAAQYIESKKPLSTVSYINDLGGNSFIQVNGNELTLPDLRVYLTSRAEDARKLEEMKGLAQHMLQNGADPYTISEIFVTKSIRQIRDAFRKDKERREQELQQAQQLQQQQLQQQQEQFQQKLENDNLKEAVKMENENLNKELDRQTKIRTALIQSASFNQGPQEDLNQDGVADVLEFSKMEDGRRAAQAQLELNKAKMLQDSATSQIKLQQDREKQNKEYELKNKELDLKEKEIQQKIKDSENKLKIAKTNKNRHDK